MAPKTSTSPVQKNNKLGLKFALLSLLALLLVGGITFAGMSLRNEANNLKAQKANSDKKIQELEQRVEELRGGEVSVDEQEEVGEFVKNFYTERIRIQKTSSERSNEDTDSMISELEEGKVTKKLKDKLNEPTENDRFYCVSDPVFSLVSVSSTKLESSYTVEVVVGLGMDSNESNHTITVDIINTEDGYKFDSTECSQ